MKYLDGRAWHHNFNSITGALLTGEIVSKCKNIAGQTIAQIKKTDLGFAVFIYSDLGKTVFNSRNFDSINDAINWATSELSALADNESFNVLVDNSESDPVRAPSHYRKHPSGVECIDVIQWFTLNIGSAMKYLWRAGLKDGNPTIQDLRKAIQYIEFEIKRLESGK